MKCPKCGQSWCLYIEIIEDGTIVICCLNTKACDYKSEPMDRHSGIALKLPTIDEIKQNWK